MKILAISGDPRKENSYRSLELIAELFPVLEMEILHLQDMDLRTCKAYYDCILKGEQQCPLKDDREMIIAKIRNAEGMILASPANSQMVSTGIKNLFDRVGYLAHRPEFFGKFALALVTSSGYGSKCAAAYINKMLTLFGFSMIPELELQFKPGEEPEVSLQKNRQAIITAINTLIIRISKGEIETPSLDRLIPFNIYKKVALRDREILSADFEYYRGKGDFYYDTQIGQVKKFIANRMSQKIINQID